MIDAKLLALLACPACQGDVVLKDNKIVCTQCQRDLPHCRWYSCAFSGSNYESKYS